MSIRIMKAVWDLRLPASITPKRTSTVKLVLLKLADNANDNGKCWPSIDRMAHETGMSYRSVTRCLRELEDADIIARVGNWSGGKKHNTYWINIDLINELAEPFEEAEEAEQDENPFDSPDAEKALQAIKQKQSGNKKKSKPIRIANIYLMKNNHDGAYKIGMTRGDPKFREETLQSQEASVELVFYFEGPESLERELHKKYSEKRIRGEWFRLSEDDVEDIEKAYK